MKNFQKVKKEKRLRRVRRVRAKVFGTASRPRLAVFRSHQHIYAQLIDDECGKTLAAASDLSLKKGKITKTELARKVGEALGAQAKKLAIKQAVFDRRHFKYHGRLQALAEGARGGGLEF